MDSSQDLLTLFILYFLFFDQTTDIILVQILGKADVLYLNYSFL